MSRGIGRTQQAILNALAERPKGDSYMSVMELAGALGLRDNQVRRAVRALEARELVMVIKLGGSWSGIGEYGPLVPRWSTYWDDKLDKYMEYGPEVPTAEVRTHWIQEPDPTESFLIRVPVDVEYVHMGMPTGASLWVKLEGEEPEYIAKDRALGG